MELMVFPLNCLLRPKCLALLLITMAIALIGLQKLILLRQSFTPSSVTTVIQRSFEPMVGTSISGSNCTENNKCSVHVFEYVMNNSLSKASPNVSSDGNKEVTGWLEDDADYSQHSEDGFFNPSESTSNDRRSDIDIMQGILDVESNAPVSKLETGNLQVSMGKASNQSMDFVPDKSTRLTNHSKVFSHVNDGQVKPSVHANVSYSTGDEKCGSSTTRDGWNGSSLWYENKEKLLCYPNCTRLQNASTMLWSYPPEAFELLLEKERGVPSMSFSEMNVQLTKNLASADSNPYFHSAADKEILDAKTRIWSTAVRRKHRDLYPPVFRNISFFKSSYELMEHTLKVYIYSEGEKPVFHQPGLHGIYASEGWFMKLLNASKFHVKEPRKVHLFYLPFSSSILRYTKAKDSHDILKLASYLKEYLDLISRKYPFWNRTGGMDHFFAACHDWVKGKSRPGSSKTATKKTATPTKGPKKTYTLPGQKYDIPEEREPLRIFYESLSKQIPSSEMAEFWMMEHGLLSPDRAKRAFEKKQRRQQQIRSGTPVKPIKLEEPRSIKKLQSAKPIKLEKPESLKKLQPAKDGELKAKKRVLYSDDDDDDDYFLVKRRK